MSHSTVPVKLQEDDLVDCISRSGKETAGKIKLVEYTLYLQRLFNFVCEHEVFTESSVCCVMFFRS